MSIEVRKSYGFCDSCTRNSNEPEVPIFRIEAKIAVICAGKEVQKTSRLILCDKCLYKLGIKIVALGV